MIKDSDEIRKEKKERRMQKLKDFNDYWKALPKFFREVIECVITGFLIIVGIGILLLLIIVFTNSLP